MQINLCCNECPALSLSKNTSVLLAIYLLYVPLISAGKKQGAEMFLQKSAALLSLRN